MAEDLLDTEVPGNCPICGVPLDSWGWGSLTKGERKGCEPWQDNMKYNRCDSCRKFVPDTARSLTRFYKELDS